MKPNCPNPKCSLPSFLGPKIKPIVRNGSYFRTCDSRRIDRYFCKLCRCYFSKATFDDRFYQKRRRENPLLLRLFASGVSQRRASLILKMNRKTVVRRFRYLALKAKKENERILTQLKKTPPSHIQFDDLETSEHTKCKPLSVALAVDQESRKILSFQVSQMPAKGHLAKISFFKYGRRRDERDLGWLKLMHEIRPFVRTTTIVTSDDNPHYPRFLRHHHPDVTHVKVKGGRGAITGQGELKKLKFDPIFSLNHTCAMMRANMNRLFRRTWCTTKNVKGLEDHLAIYVWFHNRVLTKRIDERSAGLGAS